MKDAKLKDKVLYNGSLMTIVAIKSDADGWCDTFVVTDGKETIEINDYDCVFAPDDSIRDEVPRLYSYLAKNGIYGEIYTAPAKVELLIEWGDWKHDHGFADYLMTLVGYRCVGHEVTEDDGSDCYSAIHTYTKSMKAA